jgi:dTMP kinase
MKTGKLIVVEGTDCSGKETQTNLLIKHLKSKNKKIEKLCFPMYDTPTGKIVGGSYLGKEHIAPGVFPEGATNVDPKVAALYFAADRKYNLKKVTDLLAGGTSILMDRWIESNMAHQGGKLTGSAERLAMYKWLEKLEYELLELPRPDLTIFLYMPYQFALELRKNRTEPADQHESNPEYLKQAEHAFLELAALYKFRKIDCVLNNKIRSIEEIHQEIINQLPDIL